MSLNTSSLASWLSVGDYNLESSCPLLGFPLSSDQCRLCEACGEEHENRFCAYAYSKQCLQMAKDWLGIPYTTNEYSYLLN